jgi:hypothetical protein
MHRALSLIGGMTIGLALAAAARAGPPAGSGAAGSATVYVADFSQMADAVQSSSPGAALPLHELREREKAQSLIALMSNSIVDDLVGKGISATRLPTDSALPQQGWLVRGFFVKINEGDRMRRSGVGFGSGQTDLQVVTWIDTLPVGPDAGPVDSTQTAARSSSRMPGAAVTLNPYAAAAKFVLAGQDLERNTRDTAGKIADTVAARIAARNQNQAPQQ